MPEPTTETSQSDATIGEFDYLLERIKSAPFAVEPFRHLLLENFLSPEHLARVTSGDQIRIPAAKSHEELLKLLDAAGYSVEPFPGCTTDAEDYLRCLNAKEWPAGNGVVRVSAWQCG